MSKEAFEAWFADYLGPLTTKAEKHSMWVQWQAARAAALEEAASAAFNHFVDVCRERKVDQDFVRVWCSSDSIRH